MDWGHAGGGRAGVVLGYDLACLAAGKTTAKAYIQSSYMETKGYVGAGSLTQIGWKKGWVYMALHVVIISVETKGDSMSEAPPVESKGNGDQRIKQHEYRKDSAQHTVDSGRLIVFLPDILDRISRSLSKRVRCS